MRTDSLPLADAECNSANNTDTNSNRLIYAYCYTNGDSYGYIHDHCYADSDRYGYRHTECYSHSYGQANADCAHAAHTETTTITAAASLRVP